MTDEQTLVEKGALSYISNDYTRARKNENKWHPDSNTFHYLGIFYEYHYDIWNLQDDSLVISGDADFGPLWFYYPFIIGRHFYSSILFLDVNTKQTIWVDMST